MKKMLIIILVLAAGLLPVSCSADGFNLFAPPGGSPVLQSLHLTGKLVYIEFHSDGNQLVQMDLSSGKTHTLFAAPDRSWLAAAKVSPDGKQILLAYAPPPPPGQAQIASTNLYQMPSDGSGAPSLLLRHEQPAESFSYPVWSPDGKTIYYSHTVVSATDSQQFEVRMERMAPGGQPQVMIHQAMWPRLSPDGSRLTYHSLKPEDVNDELYLADPDGSNAQPFVHPGKRVFIDDQVFSPDGKTIYFSMSDQPPVSRMAPDAPGAAPWWTYWEWPFTVESVSAHTLPGDWFRASLEDRQIEQVTHILDASMVAAFSPDGQWLVIGSLKGLYFLKPDGKHLTPIETTAIMGSMNWVP